MGHKKIQRIDPLTQTLPLGGVDSHAHLDHEDFAADLEQVLLRARQVGLTEIVNIFLDPLAFAQKKMLLDAQLGIFYALGIHPSDGALFGQDALDILDASFATEPRLVALGEIGLDYHWIEQCSKERQLDLFANQLDIAKRVQKPVIIHCREAEEDCLTLLESHGMRDTPLLWHCFGGDRDLCKRILRNGWFISVPGAVTYKGNQATRDALALIPKDHLLFETDCPYLAPMPWRGTRNEPAYTVFTVRLMAETLGCSAEDLWIECGDNARRFFGF